MNGQILNHNYECLWHGDFIYISCGELNIDEESSEYWGGIRYLLN